MAIRVRYVPTELSEGVIEVFDNVDMYAVLDDNTVELRQRTTPGRYKVVGFLHRDQWQSISDINAEV